MEHTVDGSFFATPRGWEDLSRLIQVYEKLGKKVDRDVVGSLYSVSGDCKVLQIIWSCITAMRQIIGVEQVMEGKIRKSC